MVKLKEFINDIEPGHFVVLREEMAEMILHGLAKMKSGILWRPMRSTGWMWTTVDTLRQRLALILVQRTSLESSALGPPFTVIVIGVYQRSGLR